MHILLARHIVAAKIIFTLDVTSRYHMLLGRNKNAHRHFCWLGYWTHMSLRSDSPLQNEVLLTHQFAMVIPSVCADLLQPVQGDALRRCTVPCIQMPH